MKKLSQIKAEDIRKMTKELAIIFIVTAIILLIAYKVLEIWEDADWYLMPAFMLAYMAEGLMVLSLVCFAAMKYIDYRRKDKINQCRINELEHTINELSIKKEQVKNNGPLINLTEQEETIVEKLLLELPGHKTKTDAINMKEWARFIKALEELGYISPAKGADYRGLRDWVVMLVGEKTVPNSSAFNQALREATSANIANAIDIIKKTLKTT